MFVLSNFSWMSKALQSTYYLLHIQVSRKDQIQLFDKSFNSITKNFKQQTSYQAIEK